jgi:peptidoglycan/xylan/chitin deacetylase (PgdA/CDA1 family)
MTMFVAFTVNVQGIGPELVTHEESDLVGILSHGRYAYRCGLPRYLDAFKRNNIKGTFFWPSSEAARVPDLLKRCVDEGHEIGLHGRAFEDLEKLDADKERAILREAHGTLAQLADGNPVGFRSPTTLSTSTFQILSEMGYRYDSSAIDDDAPYSLVRGFSLGPDLKPVAPAKGMVELPYAPGLQDFYHYSHDISPRRVERYMFDALDGLAEHGNGYACVTLHPRADMGLSRQAQIPIIDRLVDKVRAHGAVIRTCKEIASTILQPDGSVKWNGKVRT